MRRWVARPVEAGTPGERDVKVAGGYTAAQRPDPKFEPRFLRLVELACEGGMRLLRQDAIDKASQGVSI